MLITPDQIRAGRALLDWSQEDLANATGLARPTIVNIESSRQAPALTTIEKIEQAFNEAGLEFTSDEGVRRKTGAVEIYRGTHKSLQFFDYVLHYMEQNLGSLYISSIDSKEYERCFPGIYKSSYITGLKKLGNKIDLRRLRSGWDINYPALDHGETKIMQDDDVAAAVTFYVFGDHVAILLFLDEAVIFVIRDHDAANTYREKFLLQWEDALDPEENL